MLAGIFRQPQLNRCREEGRQKLVSLGFLDIV